ncbi:MAG: protein kinase [Candidatus Melainabacteria bacterium]|nr:protein kinase [Candidatus Melainabacteria bacterium]
MSHSDFEPGDLIADRYSVIELLGKGGMGKVFRCRDRILDKEVAIKLLLDVDAEKEAMRFQIEAKATARLNHPNILRILDFGQTGSGELFLAAEYLKGRSLASEVDGYGPYKVEEALDLAADIASALSHAHKNDVLHRDVKPSNVMLVDEEDGSRSIRLVDFGLAKVTTHDDKLTGTGVGLGSPAYCSPEQGDGKAVDERSDIYSFGCLLFYLLTGHPPFQADNPLATIFMHMKKEPPTLAEIGGTEFPAPVEALVAKCLAKDPAQRPQSCDELIELINHAIKHDPEPEQSVDSESARPENKLRTAIAASAVLAGVLILFGADQLFLSGSLTNRILMRQNAGRSTVKTEPTVDIMEEVATLTGIWTDRDLKERFKNKEILEFRMRDQAKVHGEGLAVLENTDVEAVDLTGSSIDNRACGHLSRIKNIKHLILDNCTNITDDGIKTLVRSKTLRRLDLAGTRITDRAIDYIAANTGINHLDIGDCHNIRGENLGKLVGLVHLSLSRDPLLKSRLPVLEGLPRLTSLNLNSCSLKDSDLDCIKDLNLTMLELKDNNLTDAGIKKLQSLHRLEQLDLSDCTYVSPKGIRTLAAAFSRKVKIKPDPDQAASPYTHDIMTPNLVPPSGSQQYHEAFGEWRAKDIPLMIGSDVTYLRFREMDNDLSGFEQLKQSNLRILDLTKSSVRDEDLEHLKRLPRLEHLLLNECHNITDDGIARLRSMPLSSLELMETNITDRAIAYAGEIRTLRNLNLERCPNIKGSTLDSLKMVRSINMKDCRGLEGKNLSKLLSIPHIDHIGLTSVGLEDSDIESMAGVHARRIHLSYNPELGDKTLAVLSALKDLEWADVSGCRRLTRKGIDQFYERTVSEGRNVELHGVRR